MPLSPSSIVWYWSKGYFTLARVLAASTLAASDQSTVRIDASEFQWREIVHMPIEALAQVALFWPI